MNLVIVESPAKCGKIQGFLGPSFKVLASMGHIRHLKESLDSIGLDKDFDLEFEFMKEKKSTIDSLKAAAKNSTVYLAADDDREGELIAYSVCLLLKLNPATTYRSVFHEITESAVKTAIKNPRVLDMNKVHAAQTRAALDMMIGFTMSPLLWKTVGPALSAGRCQTAALRLVCERESQIASFESSDSWKVKGLWKKSNQVPWPSTLTDDLEDEESASTYLENHHDEPHGKILKADTTQWSEKAPLPLITSTLQQQASSLFMSQPKRTMSTAQRLYESGYITYMRTDKAVISDEAATAARAYVSENYGPNYLSSTTKTKAKATTTEVKAQEAHEAIRPTDLTMKTLPATEDWSVIDRKIYGLIWTRTLQSVMAPVTGEQRTIVIVADSDDAADFTWRSSWRRTIFDGWRKISLKEKSEEEQEQEQDAEEASWLQATALKVGDKVTWTSMTAEPHSTSAKQHYNEANLIHVLEEKGIGRPSTFANLISTILDRAYVETKTFPSRTVESKSLSITPNSWPPETTTASKQVGGEKNRLSPTPLGKSVLEYLLKHFDDLFKYTYTSKMEESLDKIASGEEAWKSVLKSTWSSYKDRYTALKSEPGTASSERRRVFGDLVAVIGKKGPLLLKESPDGDKDKTVFYGWPSNTSFHELTQEQAITFSQAAQQEKQGQILGTYEDHDILQKSGKFGNYISWNGKNISCKPEDTLENIIDKIKAQQIGTKIIGAYEIRNGPYGMYMFKTAVTGPSRKFVSVPATLDLNTATEADLNGIFQVGIQQKAKAGAYGSNSRGGGTSGFRGRGRGRGSWTKK
jgi:DNA topoisomerase-1